MILPGCLGLIISWSLNYAGETEVATNVGLRKLALDLVSEEGASLGVAMSLSIPITFPVDQKMRAQGHAASVAFACGRTF